MAATCETCQFFELKYHGAGYGECRRNAPVPNALQVMDADASWPQVRLIDWCGERVPKPATSEQS